MNTDRGFAIGVEIFLYESRDDAGFLDACIAHYGKLVKHNGCLFVAVVVDSRTAPQIVSTKIVYILNW